MLGMLFSMNLCFLTTAKVKSWGSNVRCGLDLNPDSASCKLCDLEQVSLTHLSPGWVIYNVELVAAGEVEMRWPMGSASTEP